MGRQSKKLGIQISDEFLTVTVQPCEDLDRNRRLALLACHNQVRRYMAELLLLAGTGKTLH